jgi:hypothetical protein
MPYFDRDPQVDRLLNELGPTVTGYLDPPGADAVYATVRQRRRNRAVAVGALALALLGGPTVGLALATGDGSGPPADGGPSVTASAVAPGPSESASPSLSPSASATPAAPDGRISLDELKAASLDLPSWPVSAMPECKQGKGVEFVGQPVYTDVDHDGAQETAAWLWCQAGGEYKISKVVVFDRDASGSIGTLGQVLQTPSGGDEGVGMWKVWGIRATPDGHIRVDVGDYFPCCDTAGDLPQHQWRTYGWNGRRFAQTGGPTKFGPNPKITDLRVTARDLAMSKGADGAWHGTLGITVRNAGQFTAHTRVSIFGTARLTGIGGGWTGWSSVPDESRQVSTGRDIGDLPVGASRTLTLAFTSTASPSGTLDIGVNHMAEGYSGYPDKNQDDNEVRVAVRAG